MVHISDFDRYLSRDCWLPVLSPWFRFRGGWKNDAASGLHTDEGRIVLATPTAARTRDRNRCYVLMNVIFDADTTRIHLTSILHFHFALHVRCSILNLIHQLLLKYIFTFLLQFFIEPFFYYFFINSLNVDRI